MSESESETAPMPRRPWRDPRLRTLEEDSGYEIIERIGAGGMGIVYRAQDADGRDVAIKLLRPEIADDPRARERLAREVAAQQRVRNESIARILDAELDSSEAFVVTEFVPGPTLDDAVRTYGPLHPEAVREVGLALGAALEEIHGAGVVHRDLKPSNVLLRGASETDLLSFDPEGTSLDPVIIDFGIAQAAEESRLTSTGLVMGTAAYLDPEVVATDRTSEATDWWALAAMLAFAATGREPFGSGRADIVFLRADRGELDIDGVPTELAGWLRGALRANPAERTDPRTLLRRLDELDLDRYDDPGVTEIIAAGSSAAPALAREGSDAEPTAAERTQLLPAYREDVAEADDADDRTQALPAYRDDEADRTQALPVHRDDADRTQALPAYRDDEDRTQALPAYRDDAERTQALPRYEEEAPRTEALPVQRSETMIMPAVRDDVPPPQYAPQAYAEPVAERPSYDPQGYGQQMQPAYPADQVPVGTVPGAQVFGPPPVPRRPLLVWLGHGILIALAAVAPFVSLILLVLLGALARTWERSHRSLASARERGRGAGATWGVGLAWPFRYVLGLVEIVLTALLPAILGVVIAVSADVVAAYTLSGPLPASVLYAGAMAVTLLLTWLGIGGRTTRQGAHRLLDAAAPDRVWALVVGALLLLLLGAVIVVAWTRGGSVDYFPFVDLRHAEDLLPWRR